MNEFQRMRSLCHQVQTAIRFRPGETFHDEGWGWEGPAAELLECVRLSERVDETWAPPVLRVRAA